MRKFGRLCFGATLVLRPRRRGAGVILRDLHSYRPCGLAAILEYMTDTITIQPVVRPIVGTVRPPGSKSLTNRALVVAALAEGTTTLTGVLESRDTQVMMDSLRRLGVRVDAADGTARVTGCAGKIPARSADLWLENSGTSIRFLTAVCALGHGQFRLDGNTRMRERPIGDLLDSLRQFGIAVDSQLGTACPPVVVHGKGLPGGTTTINAGVSSQFLSAMLMAAPCAAGPVTVQLAGPMVSEPYIEMTLQVMSQFGVVVDRSTPGTFCVTPQLYRARQYEIEPDASAASYFFAAAVVTGGQVTVEGLTATALQGDVHFVDALQQMGCEVTWGKRSVSVRGGKLSGIDIDMNAISDTAQTLACVAPFAEGPTRIRNVAHMRHKETDRVSAVVTELSRLGLKVDEHPDGMTIHPGPVHGGTVTTYDDHRMAMSFSLLGLRVPGIVIADPDCTSKTYPDYFRDLDRLCESAR